MVVVGRSGLAKEYDASLLNLQIYPSVKAMVLCQYRIYSKSIDLRADYQHPSRFKWRESSIYSLPEFSRLWSCKVATTNTLSSAASSRGLGSNYRHILFPMIRAFHILTISLCCAELSDSRSHEPVALCYEIFFKGVEDSCPRGQIHRTFASRTTEGCLKKAINGQTPNN